MEKITAEDYIKTNLTDFWQGGKAQYTGEDVAKAMIAFAKLHVEAALKEASENVCTKYEEGSMLDPEGDWVIDKESILNSYPLDKIM